MSDSGIKFGPCCFCGRVISETGTDPCRLTVETAAEKWQVWYCHANCFKARLAASIDGQPMTDGFFDPAHF